MNLQDLINQSELDMTVPQVKAFFLGILHAEKPLNFTQALDELLSNHPEMRNEVAPQFKDLWEELTKNKTTESQNIFPQSDDIKVFLTDARDQLDYFLTAMSLSGTHAETFEDQETAEIVDELEDTVMGLDEYLSDEKASKDEGEELKELMLETWMDFLSTKKF